MTKFATFLTLAFGLASAATASVPMLNEEQVARAEEALIITAPIAGIENRFWFDYRIDVTEAQKELTSDLRRASDIEDHRDAWDEYAQELKHERFHFIEKMAERGYRMGQVIFDD